MVLKKGEKAKVIVNKAEREAIAQVIRRLASATDEFEDDVLKRLLDKIDKAPRV